MLLPPLLMLQPSIAPTMPTKTTFSRTQTANAIMNCDLMIGLQLVKLNHLFFFWNNRSISLRDIFASFTSIKRIYVPSSSACFV
mmetsp:Transcript_50413/g.64629  ORF Transcript_50413/g.64629 Transcript_50413/m.64629 type:complete len:84 (+) Transcript_50413:530-781(+)